MKAALDSSRLQDGLVKLLEHSSANVSAQAASTLALLGKSP